MAPIRRPRDPKKGGGKPRPSLKSGTYETSVCLRWGKA